MGCSHCVFKHASLQLGLTWTGNGSTALTGIEFRACGNMSCHQFVVHKCLWVHFFYFGGIYAILALSMTFCTRAQQLARLSLMFLEWLAADPQRMVLLCMTTELGGQDEKYSGRV